MKNKAVQVVMSERLRERLSKRAHEAGLSESEVVRGALTRELGDVDARD